LKKKSITGRQFIDLNTYQLANIINKDNDAFVVFLQVINDIQTFYNVKSKLFTSDGGIDNENNANNNNNNDSTYSDVEPDNDIDNEDSNDADKYIDNESSNDIDNKNGNDVNNNSIISNEKIRKMTVKQLQQELNKMNLPLNGKKDELIERLKAFISVKHYGIKKAITLIIMSIIIMKKWKRRTATITTKMQKNKSRESITSDDFIFDEYEDCENDNNNNNNNKNEEKNERRKIMTIGWLFFFGQCL